MNKFAFVFLVAQAVLLQNAFAQLSVASNLLGGSLLGSSCGCGSSVISSPVISAASPVVSSLPVTGYTTVIPSSGVASNLADTLNILTVTSLLNDKLPYGLLSVPSCSGGCGGYGNYGGYGSYGGCGCGGCGCGCGCCY